MPAAKFEPILAMGLMSGTSADGVDAALLRTDGESAIEWVDAVTLEYDAGLRGRLLNAAQHDIKLEEVILLEKRINGRSWTSVPCATRKESDRFARSDWIPRTNNPS